ncbi:sushi domain-containing protein 3-like [Dendropsophus ebraccatus]|uniref:sushi domain-containing protein 3-like n=1 Tax=Dendropsophus ebraccatus TaxID=150705 RepID=UPI00383111FF
MSPITLYTFYLILPGISAAGEAQGGNKTLDAVIPTTPNFSGAARCPVLTAPSGGSFHVFEAAERSLGSVALFSCQEGFQLQGQYKLRCQKRGDGLRWSHQEPQCQAVSLSAHKGFRLAVIISLVSCFIIITMFVAFTVCCVRERLLSQQGEAPCARSDPRPGFSIDVPENFSSGGGFQPNSLRESNLYRSVTFKGPNGFENCGFQT